MHPDRVEGFQAARWLMKGEACFKSSDYKEGQAAFMEKRKPHFIGA